MFPDMNWVCFPLYRYVEVSLLSLSPFSMRGIPYWHIARLVIFPQPFMGEMYILRLASYLLNSGALVLPMLKYVIAVTYVKYSAAATASRFCLIFSDFRSVRIQIRWKLCVWKSFNSFINLCPYTYL